MLLTIPSVISCVVVVLALLMGVATIAISAGPGWRELRWFGAAAICASVYGVAALTTTLDVPVSVRPFFGRLGGASASLLVACWFVYYAFKYGRALAGYERVVVVGIVVVAAAWLVPGLCRSSIIFVRTVRWLGVSYVTTRPTLLGKVTYALLVLATFILAGRVFVFWRRGKPGALADFLGISVQLVAGVNDALAASGKVEMPYTLDLGQFAVVLSAGATLIARFVADARALERSSANLRAAQTELLRRERLSALGELSAVVAHEVRNPVAVIFNALATLRKQPDSGDMQTLLRIVNEEAERLKRVVDELLDFARPRELTISEVSPGPLVRSAVEAAVLALEEAQSAESVNMESEQVLPQLNADEQLLRQAMINLITNALQARGRTGRVIVRTRAESQPEASVCFDVVDDGAGISEDVEDKLFTPFFTTRASGTGLGLAIVKRIAEAHGGDVTWRRGETGGAIFTLRVPTRPD